MKTSALTIDDRRWGKYLIVALIAALLLGSAAAWAMRERSLLDVPASALLKVQRMDSAEQQYEYARLFSGDEAAWRSIEQYFPNDKRTILKAKEGAAKLYLMH